MRALIAIVAVLGVLAAAIPQAADAAQSSPRFGDLVKQQTPAASPAAGCAGYDGETKAACESYARATFDHQVWALQYRQRAYEAHHWYTMLVFILVCALVALGMCLSWREFNLDSRRREALIGQLTKRLKRIAGVKPEEGKPDEGDAGVATSTTLAIDPTGVKLTSPVLGVIILVVSMGFFYLYLKTVYPINEISGIEPAAAQPAPQTPAKP